MRMRVLCALVPAATPRMMGASRGSIREMEERNLSCGFPSSSM